MAASALRAFVDHCRCLCPESCWPVCLNVWLGANRVSLDTRSASHNTSQQSPLSEAQEDDGFPMVHVNAISNLGFRTVHGLPNLGPLLSDAESIVVSLHELRQSAVAEEDAEPDGTESVQLDEFWNLRRRRRRNAIVTSRANLLPWSTDVVDFLAHPLEVDVSTAETTLHSTMRSLRDAVVASLRPGVLRVEFRGQPGSDAGGLRRDWFARIGEVASHAKYGLLLPAEEGQVQLRPSLPSVASGLCQEVPSWWWECFGKLLGSSVLHDEPLGLHFIPSLCRQLLGAVAVFEDLEAVHPVLFRSLRSLRKLKVVGIKTAIEQPGCVILQTNATHGAKPDETVIIQGSGAVGLDGEHRVCEIPGLDRTEIGIKPDSPASPESWEAAGLDPPVLRRYPSAEVSKILELFNYSVPSRLATIREVMPDLRRRTGSDMSSIVVPRRSSASLAGLDFGRTSSDTRSEPSSCSSESRLGSPMESTPRSSLARPHSTASRGTCRVQQLTPQNLEEYIAAAVDKLLRANVMPQLEAMSHGFKAVLGERVQEWPAEEWQTLQQLLRGQLQVDLSTWRAATQTQGFASGSPIVDWWFEVLERSSPGARQAVLRWSTGWAAIPGAGWPADVYFVLSSRPDLGPAHLPQAHTCTYTVDIPRYDSVGQLEAKLLQAVAEFDFGFA